MEIESKKLIEVRNLSKNFDNKIIHKSISFHVNEGECLGLLGGSGVGKSVLLRCLVGLERPDTGEIYFDGQLLNHQEETSWVQIRKKIAYVFQYGALFDSLTVFENVAYSLIEHTNLATSEIKKQVSELLSEFNLPGTENLLPAELSGGMQKRIGLARAIILNPKVVLYDEPTAGLDPANTIIIQDLILHLKSRGTTSILVTHDIDTALRVCDRICFVQNHSIQDLGRVYKSEQYKNNLINQFIGGPQT